MWKTFLNGLHKAVKWSLHIILIPVIALLKALLVGLQHLHDNLEKV